MQIPVTDLYRMTLGEFDNAVIGFYKKQSDDLQWQLYSARMISYYACAPHQGKNAKIRKPNDLFPLEIDKQLKKERIKKLKIINVEQRDQQSNG